MKNKGFVSIIASLIILAVGFTGLYSYSKKVNEKLGAVNVPVLVARVETTLSTAITTTDTSMTLVTGTFKGTALSGRMCFTLEGGKTTEEFVCGTASSTAITALTRGIDYVNPNATSSALLFAHRAGSNVKITDWPQSGIISRMINGNDAFPNVLKYDASVTNAQISASITNLVNYNLLASTSYVGTVPMTWSLPGIGILATGTELVAGTATTSYSGTNYRLLAPNSFFASTSTATTLVPVTNSSGKLSTGFIDQTGNYVWTGTHSFSGNITATGTASFASTTINNTLSVTGTSTFIGTTTFGGIPNLPTATATANYQVPSKVYVDESLSGKLTGIQSTVVSSSTFSNAFATTTLFITAFASSSGSDYISLSMGATTTAMWLAARDTNSANQWASVSALIPKNYYYSIALTSGSLVITTVAFGN